MIIIIIITTIKHFELSILFVYVFCYILFCFVMCQNHQTIDRFLENRTKKLRHRVNSDPDRQINQVWEEENKTYYILKHEKWLNKYLVWLGATGVRCSMFFMRKLNNKHTKKYTLDFNFWLLFLFLLFDFLALTFSMALILAKDMANVNERWWNGERKTCKRTIVNVI